ncbi:hypothetical protein OG225_40525 (plasmid) [Nocardia sp. NBC_01377]
MNTPQWNNAFDHRGENFHRWRREHEYVSGIDQGTGHARDVLDHKGQVTGKRYGSYSTRYTAADGLGEQAVLNARSGLEETAQAANDVLDHILEALPELARGFTLTITATGYKISRPQIW